MIYSRAEQALLRALSVSSRMLPRAQFVRLVKGASGLMHGTARRMLRGVMACYDGEYELAVRELSTLVRDNARNTDAVTSLGYCLSFHGSPRLWQLAAEQLDVGRPPDAGEAAASMLRLDLALKVDAEGSERQVERWYLETLVRPFVNGRAKRPILLWHIPKCSGTSVSHALGAYFYSRDPKYIIPPYTALHLLRYALERIPDALPYWSSRHMGIDVLRPTSDLFQFTILRDPVKRVLSAWRQTQRAAKDAYHYGIVPRYGHDWFYWPPPGLGEWVAKVPRALLLQQLRTFSPSDHAAEASERIRTLDGAVSYDLELDDLDDVLQRAEVPRGYADLPRDMNRSPRGPIPGPAELQSACDHLEPEYRMLARLGALHSGHSSVTGRD